jgi:hypothetical protein
MRTAVSKTYPERVTQEPLRPDSPSRFNENTLNFFNDFDDTEGYDIIWQNQGKFTPTMKFILIKS